MEIQIKDEKKVLETVRELEEMYYLSANEGEILVVRLSLTVEPINNAQ